MVTLTKQISVLQTNIFRFELVVVDDGSSDGTGEWLRVNYPSVHVLEGDGGLWWSGSINKGVDYAINSLDAEYILWWNNDIVPADNYFETLVESIGRYSNDVVIGSKIFILEKNLIWGMGGRFNPARGISYMYGWRQKDGPAFGEPFEVDWFPGMGTIIHRNVFEKIGLLDNKNFPQYNGDSDFTYRARKAGFRLVAEPGLVIYNDVSNTGLKHQGKFSYLIMSLTSIKSNFNIKKEFAFYRKHATSPLAYLNMLYRYFRYIGGFYKWKVLGLFGITRP